MKMSLSFSPVEHICWVHKHLQLNISDTCDVLKDEMQL